MRQLSRSPIESLEQRRLFAEASLVIDTANSPISATATLNGAPATPTVNSGFLDGELDISYTRRGIRFLGGGGASVTNGTTPIAFTFNGGIGTPTGVNVSSLEFSFTSGRINVADKKFTTTRLTADDFSGFGLFGLLGDDLIDFSVAAGDRLDYAVGRAKRTGVGLNSLAVDVPFAFQFSETGGGQTLVVNVTGRLVGTAEVFASGASIQLAPAATPDEDDAARVADDVLG